MPRGRREKPGEFPRRKRVPLISISEPCSTSAGFIHRPSSLFLFLHSVHSKSLLEAPIRRRIVEGEKRAGDECRRRGRSQRYSRNMRRRLFSLINGRARCQTLKPIHFPDYQYSGNSARFTLNSFHFRARTFHRRQGEGIFTPPSGFYFCTFGHRSSGKVYKLRSKRQRWRFHRERETNRFLNSRASNG